MCKECPCDHANAYPLSALPNIYKCPECERWVDYEELHAHEPLIEDYQIYDTIEEG